jgi:hypothetical protein
MKGHFLVEFRAIPMSSKEDRELLQKSTDPVQYNLPDEIESVASALLIDTAEVLHGRQDLFCPQRNHGTRPGGSASGQIAGDQCNRNHSESNCRESQRVSRTDVVHQALQDTAKSERDNHADKRAGNRESRGLRKNQPQHVPRRSAESQAQTKLGNSLAYRIRDYSIRSNRSQNDRQSRKQSYKKE